MNLNNFKLSYFFFLQKFRQINRLCATSLIYGWFIIDNIVIQYFRLWFGNCIYLRYITDRVYCWNFDTVSGMRDINITMSVFRRINFYYQRCSRTRMHSQLIIMITMIMITVITLVMITILCTDSDDTAV